MLITKVYDNPRTMTKEFTVEVDARLHYEIEQQVISKLSDKIVEAFMINYGETFMANINLEKLTEVVNEELIVKMKECLK